MSTAFCSEHQALLSVHECASFIGWAKLDDRQAERGQPTIRVLPEFYVSTGVSKINATLRNFAALHGIDVYDGPAKIQVLHYQDYARVAWHSDYRPLECNYKVSMTLCLEPGDYAFEYVAGTGVVQFVGSVGDVVLFPSWVTHHVLPTKELEPARDRWSLAAWLRGPEYK
jgi:hypothetical protein